MKHPILIATALALPLSCLAEKPETTATPIPRGAAPDVVRKTYVSSEHPDIVNESVKKAKQMVVACKLYALDYNGRFPETLWDLVPDYLPTLADLKCPLSPEERYGYDYFGGGSDRPREITLRSKALTPAGERLEVFNNGETELTKAPPIQKAASPPKRKRRSSAR
jgi:hypothetical protein